MSPARASLALFHIPSFTRNPSPLKLRHGFVDGQEISLPLFLRHWDDVRILSVNFLYFVDLVLLWLRSHYDYHVIRNVTIVEDN